LEFVADADTFVRNDRLQHEPSDEHDDSRWYRET
jgi:hypothetical protein